MLIHFSTIESGMSVSQIESEIKDGYQVLAPAVGGGRCADGTYVRNLYNADMIGQAIRFIVQISQSIESNIEYMIENYTEFILSFATKCYRVGIDSFQFGTGKDTIDFTILEEY